MYRTKLCYRQLPSLVTEYLSTILRSAIKLLYLCSSTLCEERIAQHRGILEQNFLAETAGFTVFIPLQTAGDSAFGHLFVDVVMSGRFLDDGAMTSGSLNGTAAYFEPYYLTTTYKYNCRYK